MTGRFLKLFIPHLSSVESGINDITVLRHLWRGLFPDTNAVRLENLILMKAKIKPIICVKNR